MEMRLQPRWFILLTAIVVAVWAVPSAGILICMAAAVHALRGAKESIQALTVLALLLILGGTDVSVSRWLVLFAAAGRTAWDTILSDAPVPRLFGPLLLFVLTIFVCSVLVSPFPTVSILKLVVFTVGVGTVVTGFYRTMHLREYWASWLITLGFFIVVASAPLYVSPLGYTRNGVGFQGILNHPQVYGAALAPMTALMTGAYAFQKHRGWWAIVGIGLGWIGIFMSLARTAMLAVALGFVIAVAVGGVLKARTWGASVLQTLGRMDVLLALAGTLCIVTLQWSSVQQNVMAFLLKDDRAEAVTGILEESRGQVIDRSMENFWSAPLTGIGFGVPSDPDRFTRQLEIGPLGIPTSASVEKGFMPSAVLEETGISGAILVVVLIVSLVLPVIRSGSITLFWTITTCLLVNLGEMVFFSVGGMGFYFWIIMCFCHVYAVKNIENKLYNYSK